MEPTNAQSGDKEIDTPSLLSGLSARGIRHLRVREQPVAYKPLSDQGLIAMLAAHPEPRLRESLIPLFLRHPGLSEQVPQLVDALPAPAADTLRHMYTAAVYLQYFWHSTLGLYLRNFPRLPDFYGQTIYGLPSPDDRFGESGLRALAAQFAQETGFEWLSVYTAAIDLLLRQLSLEETRHA
jgi:hypothetical protein